MRLHKCIAILTAPFVGGVWGFIPGYIPPGSWLSGHGFRHGDIESVLGPWINKTAPTSGGWEWDPNDVNRIYFGNWLRDYSQIVDTHALAVLNVDILVSIIELLAYVEMGYSGEEFEIDLGYPEVFPFVGNDTQIPSPSGKMVFPLVTGTFTGYDYAHSTLGSVADWLSQSSMTALKEKVQRASLKQSQRYKNSGTKDFGTIDTIKNIVANITTEAKELVPPGDAKGPAASGPRRRSHLVSHDSRSLVARDTIQPLLANATPNKDPKDMEPSELQKAMSGLLKLKDKVEGGVKSIIQMGKHEVQVVKEDLDALGENVEGFVLHNLELLITPIISLATERLYAVMNDLLIRSEDQWEVFNNTKSTNPTHSLLSKDHFRVILNEPAGMIAQMITLNAVQKVSQAWVDANLDVDAMIEDITQSLFHPDFPTAGSDIQGKMLGTVKSWLDSMDRLTLKETIRRLNKDSISNMQDERFEIEHNAAKDQVKGVVDSVKGRFRGHATSTLPGPSATIWS
ncbi:hypothetical protein FRB99_008575 [Tulasnella sp. 403]|nr:hypothetical protein FRB99_008575 [Tulasnella sp. 403]